MLWTYAAIAMLGKGEDTAAGVSLAASLGQDRHGLAVLHVAAGRKALESVDRLWSDLADTTLPLSMYGPGRVPGSWPKTWPTFELRAQVGEINDYRFRGLTTTI